MAPCSRPTVISAPDPRALELIFTPAALQRLRSSYQIVEVEPDALGSLSPDVLRDTRYIVGQPPLSAALLDHLVALRCVFNVEGNFLDNMPYDRAFERGIHVVSTMPVFAEPVAELAIALALSLARDVTGADEAFRDGRELWGLDSNRSARLLSGSDIGFIGFGDLGRAVLRLLSGFRAVVRGYDPWVPDAVLRSAGVIPASLDEVLSLSDHIFAVASVTSENQGFIGAEQFACMRPGSAFILLSRAGIVDFDALMAAVRRGHIRGASDVFPIEPPPLDDPARQPLHGFIRSAHRAGALDCAFKAMGDLLLDDMGLMDRGLPPVRCKRAERETVAMMRSKPVDRS